jgi:hypothetical protein
LKSISSNASRVCGPATHGPWIYATKMDASFARNAAPYPTADVCFPTSTLPISSGALMKRVDLPAGLDACLESLVVSRRPMLAEPLARIRQTDARQITVRTLALRIHDRGGSESTSGISARLPAAVHHQIRACRPWRMQDGWPRNRAAGDAREPNLEPARYTIRPALGRSAGRQAGTLSSSHPR